MINRARAEPTLLHEIGFEVHQKIATFSLALRKRRSLRHAYLDQVLDEKLGEVVSPSGFLLRCQTSPALCSEIDRQIGWRNVFRIK